MNVVFFVLFHYLMSQKRNIGSVLWTNTHLFKRILHFQSFAVDFLFFSFNFVQVQSHGA